MICEGERILFSSGGLHPLAREVAMDKLARLVLRRRVSLLARVLLGVPILTVVAFQRYCSLELS